MGGRLGIVITLYRRAESADGDRVQEVLTDLVLAHSVVTVDRVPPEVSEAATLPVVVDAGRVVAGDDLGPYLEELTDYLAEWSRYQSDSCYVDKDDRFC